VAGQSNYIANCIGRLVGATPHFAVKTLRDFERKCYHTTGYILINERFDYLQLIKAFTAEN